MGDVDTDAYERGRIEWIDWRTKRQVVHKCHCHACWERRSEESPLDDIPVSIRGLFEVVDGKLVRRAEKSADRETLHAVAVAMQEMHQTKRVAMSTTARMVLRKLGYIMSGMDPELAAKLESMFEKGDPRD